MRALSALLLCLLLVLTGETAAVARGQPAPVGVAVYCIGGGLAAVPVDAEGRPTGPAHPCPDAVAGLLAIGAPAALAARASDLATAAEPPVPPALSLPPRRARAVSPRGPPSSV